MWSEQHQSALSTVKARKFDYAFDHLKLTDATYDTKVSPPPAIVYTNCVRHTSFISQVLKRLPQRIHLCILAHGSSGKPPLSSSSREMRRAHLVQ